MEKKKIIDFPTFSDTAPAFQSVPLELVEPRIAQGISTELEEAIEELIIRLREARPLPDTKHA